MSQQVGPATVALHGRSGEPADSPTGGAGAAELRTGSGRSTSRSRSPLAPRPVWIAAGLLLLVSVLWAVLTPATRAPDEVHHLNSILRLADGGGWPRPGDGRLDDGIRTLRELSGATHGGMQTTLPGSVNPRPDAPLWTSVPPTLVEDRASLAELMREDGTPRGSTR